MKKILAITVATFLILPKITLAFCPVCTVAVGAGVGLAEWLGIDDLISGLWIGALVVSISIWTINWLKVRLWGIPATLLPEGKSRTLTNKQSILSILIFVAYYAIIIFPLYWKGFIGHPLNKFCGVDKLLFGIILGSMLFSAGLITHSYLRQKNGGKSYFKGQKIVFAVAPLVIASLVLHFTC
jgi:hypothetical protein